MDQREIYGFDFGTSNSTIALNTSGSVWALPISTDPNVPEVVPTIIYYERGRILCGLEAFNAMRHREGDGEGRIIRGIKSAATIDWQDSTYIVNKRRKYVDIISDYISYIKNRADKHIGKDVRSVVIGRPIVSSKDKDQEGERLAQERITLAAQMAGFDEVYFAYEPVAATVNEIENIPPERYVITFDFGGGTLDLHLLRTTSDKQGRRSFNHLNSSGLFVGGEEFTESIIRNKVLKYFGKDMCYIQKNKGWRTRGEEEVPIPQHLPSTIIEADVNRGPLFYREITKTVKQIFWEAGEPIEELENLLICLENGYYFDISDIVDNAKIELSDTPQAQISFNEDGIQINETITKEEFEEMLSPYGEKIRSKLEELIYDADLKREEINAVIRIGGTSKIPFFIDMLRDLFPLAQLIENDIFTGVAKGLARIGHDPRFKNLLFKYK